MAQQLFSPPGPPPSSRWEGGGYHSDSSRSVSDDKCLQTTTIILPNYPHHNNNNNNNHLHIPIQTPQSIPIKKTNIPPPPQMNYNNYIQQTYNIPSQHIQINANQYNNNNKNSISTSVQTPIFNDTLTSNIQSSQSKTPSIPFQTNGLIQLSTADSIVECEDNNYNYNTPMNTNQLSCNNINIIKQGEMDDGIESIDASSIDVDHININESINDIIDEINAQIDKEIEIENENSITNKLQKCNENINLIFGHPLIRSLYMNATLFFPCILTFPLWFGDVNGIDKKTDTHITNAYIIAAFSMFVTFIASGFGLIFGIFDIFALELPFKKIAKNITITLYFVGGLFHFISACQYAHFYNSLGVLLNEDLSGFGGICFGEMFYISMYIIILGIDFYKPFLNRMDFRIYIFFGLYIFIALILMFSYIICSDKLNGNYGFIVIGIFYLFEFIVCVMFLLMTVANNFITDEFVIKPKLEEIKPKFDLVLGVLMAIFMFCTVIAYWVTERIRDAEKVYYIGFGIFILANTVFMTFDMRFSLYIAKFIVEDDENNETNE